jgi:hypothetical protein
MRTPDETEGDKEIKVTLLEMLDIAEESAEKATQYASVILAMRRRVKNALDLLGEGRADEARQMLVEALADDGTFVKKRIDKVVAKWRDEQGF